MSILTDTAPQRVWLCISDEPDDYNTPYPELYAEDAEITWSTDQPVAVTVEYVRADLSEITKLRAERDNAIAECVMHIGNAKALRDRLKWFEDAGGVAMATRIYQVTAERDALRALLDRVLSCTDLHGWNGAKAELLCDEIDAVLKDKP